MQYPSVQKVSTAVRKGREFKYIDDYLVELSIEPTASRQEMFDYVLDQYNLKLKGGMKPTTARIVVLYNFSKDLYAVAKELYSTKGVDKLDETTDDRGGDT